MDFLPINPWWATLVSSFFSSVITFLFSRRRYKTEIKSLKLDNQAKHIDNAQEIIEMYRKAHKEMENRFKDQIQEMNNHIQLLQDQINELKTELAKCKEKYS